MQSPKFAIKVKHLKGIVSASVLQALWKQHIRDKMRRQILPDPIEFLDFHVQLKQRANEIESAVCAGSYSPKPVLRLKVEKGNGLCRQVALPAPEDALLLQALANALWKEIGPKAPSSNAFFAQEDQAFAKKNREEGDFEWGYGPIEAWLDFQKSILGFSKKRRYVVVTDIANYYDFILHSFLRSILSDYANEREHALDLLVFIVDSMLWRPDYMPNYGIGLPQMDFDAPRLLAHTHLFEVDELFDARPNVDFARYMDDMDFGVDSIAAAKEVLRDLDLTLQTRNLRLNSGKTKILTAADALQHFRALDNARIDILQGRIKSASGVQLRLHRRLISRLIDSGLKRGRFDGGNGEKILKRLLTTLLGLDAPLSKEAFREILYQRPALRQIILRHWSIGKYFDDMHSAVVGFLGSGQAVDDLAYILIARSLVETHMTSPAKPGQIDDLLVHYNRQDPIQLYCRLWIKSRYASVHELKSEIDQTNLIWSRHSYLIRLVAGFYSLFINTPHQPAFVGAIRKWGGPTGVAMIDFLESVSQTAAGYNAIRKFIAADNPSVSNGITHAKTLLLAAMLWNDQIPKLERAKLLGVHSRMMNDWYFQGSFSALISAAP